MTAISASFRGTWLTDPVSHQSIAAKPVAGRAGGFQQGGSFRNYAGGRVRVITTKSKVRANPITLQSLTDADLALVEAWAGRVLLLRDQWGTRRWVSYLQPQWVDVLADDGVSLLHDVTLPLTEITYNESVPS